MILRIALGPDTERRLASAAKQKGRSMTDLAEAAVDEAALEWAKSESDEFKTPSQKGLPL